MLKSYKFWAKIAIVLQFLTAGLHSLSFFVTPDLNNDTERQIHDLIHNYREDMGAGFHRSFWDLFTALSACYPLLCVLAALTLTYLLRKDAPPSLTSGILGINALIFGIATVVMFVFAFLPPIVMTGLIFANLSIAYYFCPRNPVIVE